MVGAMQWMEYFKGHSVPGVPDQQSRLQVLRGKEEVSPDLLPVDVAVASSPLSSPTGFTLALSTTPTSSFLSLGLCLLAHP